LSPIFIRNVGLHTKHKVEGKKATISMVREGKKGKGNSKFYKRNERNISLSRTRADFLGDRRKGKGKGCPLMRQGPSSLS